MQTSRNILWSTVALAAVAFPATACAPELDTLELPAVAGDLARAPGFAEVTTGEDVTPTLEDALAAALNLPDVPSAVQQLGADASCGTFVLYLEDKVPSTALDCMNAAIGEADAQLVVSRPTDEGDPVVYFYFTDAAGPGVTARSYDGWDTFGMQQGWGEWECADLVECGLRR